MDNLPALPDDQADRLIAMAIDKGVSVEALEKLLAMRTQLRLESAEEQYNIAMANFQAECPTIVKKKRVTIDNIVAYRYAPIETIIAQVKHLLQKYTFSYSFKMELNTDGLIATCIARHSAGHRDSSSFPTPLVIGTKRMSEPQIVAATLTFAKRYAFCGVFGISTGDEDTDAVAQAYATPPQPITREQTEELYALSVEAELPLSVILKQYNAATPSQLTRDLADVVIRGYKQYIERTQIRADINKQHQREDTTHSHSPLLDDDIPF